MSRVLFLLPAETAHRLAFALLRLLAVAGPLRALAQRWLVADDPVLRTEAFGLTFPTPVGLAAGFDKDAGALPALVALGFGHIEVGTVTPEPQPGNPRPRVFRLREDRAIVNRMGFNSAGAAAVASRLRRFGAAPGSPRGAAGGEGGRGAAPRAVLGVNIGRNKTSPDAVADFVRGARELGPLADYVTVNVSSPNTPGLRDLQAVAQLRPLLEAVTAATDRPVLVKIAPDLADEDVDAVADLAMELGLAGIVATNTTIARDGLSTPSTRLDEIGAGGLSGAPLGERAREVLARLRARVGDRLVLVAAGGIADADDAWERIEAGATLVQLYTGFVLGGPRTAATIARGLAERARATGLERVQDAVGRATGAPPQAALR